jgi:hypothetical protein
MMSRELSLKFPPRLRTAVFIIGCTILSQLVPGCSTVENLQTGELSGERVKIRGKIVTADGENFRIATTTGEVLVRVPENTRISGIAAAQLSEIVPGSYVGTTATKQADGSLKALEVHIFPEEARGAGEGHRPWDLTSDSTMTNATVEKVEQVSVGNVPGFLMKLKYKDGDAKVFVPSGTPIVKNVPTDRSALKPGAGVYIPAVREAGGTLIARRVIVGVNGVMPPM